MICTNVSGSLEGFMAVEFRRAILREAVSSWCSFKFAHRWQTETLTLVLD